MGSPVDLISLADAKAWLYKTPDAIVNTNDALIGQLITRMSQLALGWLNRPGFAAKSISEVRDGTGGKSLMLARWPVISVSSVVAGGQSIPAAPAIAAGVTPQPGFSFEAWDGTPPGSYSALALNGYGFPRGQQNVRIDYVAGYQVTAEPQTVTDAAATVIAPSGPWLADGGVTYVNGTTLAKVASVPAPGQYALDGTTAGKYVFNAADESAAVLITYSFTPGDVVQAIIEWLADRYAYMQRVGEASKSTGGQVTVSYIVKAIPDFVQLALQPYRYVLPI